MPWTSAIDRIKYQYGPDTIFTHPPKRTKVLSTSVADSIKTSVANQDRFLSPAIGLNIAHAMRGNNLTMLAISTRVFGA
jgi:hypothetical protein